MLTNNARSIVRQWFMGHNTYMDPAITIEDTGQIRCADGSYRTGGSIYGSVQFCLWYDIWYVNLWGPYHNYILTNATAGSVSDQYTSLLVLGEDGTPETRDDYRLGSPLFAEDLTGCMFECRKRELITQGAYKGRLCSTYRLYAKNASGRVLHIRELGRWVQYSVAQETSVFALVERQTFPVIDVPPDAMLVFDYSTVF